MKKVRILGISGSPRPGNTEFAVKEALSAAAEIRDVETEFYSFAGKTMNPCVGCWGCSSNRATEEVHCTHWGEDDIVRLVKTMMDFDGYIVGTPIYILEQSLHSSRLSLIGRS